MILRGNPEHLAKLFLYEEMTFKGDDPKITIKPVKQGLSITISSSSTKNKERAESAISNIMTVYKKMEHIST